MDKATMSKRFFAGLFLVGLIAGSLAVRGAQRAKVRGSISIIPFLRLRSRRQYLMILCLRCSRSMLKPSRELCS